MSPCFRMLSVLAVSVHSTTQGTSSEGSDCAGGRVHVVPGGDEATGKPTVLMLFGGFQQSSLRVVFFFYHISLWGVFFLKHAFSVSADYRYKIA